MKITIASEKVKHAGSLVVGFDVGQSKLNALSRV